MKRYVTILALLSLFSVQVWARDPAGPVAVVPFGIHTAKPSKNLSKTIQWGLVDFLSQEGLRVISPDRISSVVSKPVLSPAEARRVGQKVMARYVLFGTFNQIGESISLDASLLDISGQSKTRYLYADETGMENLASVIRKMGEKVTIQLSAKILVADIRVEGNERIDKDAILMNIKSHKGEIYRPSQVREDIRSIYDMGYFETVAVDKEETPKGVVLTYHVKEKPTVVEVRIVGNDAIKEKDILAALTTKPYSVLQRKVIAQDVQRILKLYREKAYYDTRVHADIQFPRDPRKAVVTFAIKEGRKFYVKEIHFEGNHHFSERKLRGIMVTKARSWYSFFSDKGVLQRDVLDTDLDRIAAYYHDHGYMDVRVGSPKITRAQEGFHITIPIIEGPRYRIASVKLTGDPIPGSQKLSHQFHLKKGDYFSREKLRKDLEMVTKFYMDRGYAYAEVDPQIRRSQKTRQATIAFHVTRKHKVHIEKITISGNTKTRDKVIRRELRLAEGDIFNQSALERSNLNLKKLDFFEKAEIQPSEGSQPDSMNLHIKIKEKPTGSVSIGGGFSSDNGVFFGGDIIQRNLFGRGQYFALKGYFGGETNHFSLSFTEPWVMDTPLSAGIDIYDWYREYNDFNKDATGVKTKISHPFGNWSRWYLSYVFENAKVSDVDENAALIIQDQEGRQIKSAIIASVSRDSTDHPFLPTRGSMNTLTVEYATPYLGSDSDFVSIVANSGWYIPAWWKFIFFVRGKIGWIFELDEDRPVPIYERFFLGGMNSIRAFNWGDVGPRDKETGDSIGGLKFGLFNLELLFPLMEKMGMRGVIFFDAGNAFDKHESFDIGNFRTAAGGGIRWNSPMGPLRIEWGYNLDPKKGEDKSNWQFSMGVFF